MFDFKGSKTVVPNKSGLAKAQIVAINPDQDQLQEFGLPGKPTKLEYSKFVNYIEQEDGMFIVSERYERFAEHFENLFKRQPEEGKDFRYGEDEEMKVKVVQVNVILKALNKYYKKRFLWHVGVAGNYLNTRSRISKQGKFLMYSKKNKSELVYNEKVEDTYGASFPEAQYKARGAAGFDAFMSMLRALAASTGAVGPEGKELMSDRNIDLVKVFGGQELIEGNLDVVNTFIEAVNNNSELVDKGENMIWILLGFFLDKQNNKLGIPYVKNSFQVVTSFFSGITKSSSKGRKTDIPMVKESLLQSYLGYGANIAWIVPVGLAVDVSSENLQEIHNKFIEHLGMNFRGGNKPMQNEPTANDTGSGLGDDFDDII